MKTSSLFLLTSYIFLLTSSLFLLPSCTERVSNATNDASLPDIYPDYVDVTIPVGIAPLNFGMKSDEALLVDAVITDDQGNTLHGQGRETTGFDIDRWHQLVAQNVGKSLNVTVSAKFADGWHTYQPFHLYVSTDSIDYGLCYRLIEPGYEVWSKMGIYQRNLSTFEQTPLIENTQFEGCVNCHGFNRGDPSRMSLHIRGAHGATLLLDEGRLTAYNTKTDKTLGFCVYPYWHPSGRYIAYSTNTTRQIFHSRHANRIEVFDEASDVQVYDVANNRLIITPSLTTDSLYETFPVFSADGRTLYFTAAHAIPEGSMLLDSVRYSLYGIDFDADRGTYGSAIRTVVDNGDCCSICFPRPSYDGRFLVYTVADYGQFSIWHHEAERPTSGCSISSLANAVRWMRSTALTPKASTTGAAIRAGWCSVRGATMASSRVPTSPTSMPRVTPPSPSCYRSRIPVASIANSLCHTMCPTSSVGKWISTMSQPHV